MTLDRYYRFSDNLNKRRRKKEEKTDVFCLNYKFCQIYQTFRSCLFWSCLYIDAYQQYLHCLLPLNNSGTEEVSPMRALYCA